MADPSPSASPPSASPPSTAESRRRIDAEHRNLDALLVELVAERDPGLLASLLDQLQAQLAGHFATEEAPEGLHEIVSQHAPHRLPNLQQLFVEHRDLQRQVERLRDDTAALLAGPLTRIHEQVEALAASLRAHEAVEDEIFGEAFYTDIGGRA